MDELVAALRELGAVNVGFADLRALPPEGRQGMPFGVSIAVEVTPAIVSRILSGPAQEYADEYDRTNAQLDELSTAAARFLWRRGHRAIPLPATRAGVDWTALRSPLPHKTVATRAGLGWIGKCALLITEDFGAAVRITTVLTDAPLPAAQPLDESQCGDCVACMEACPGHAVSGRNWRAGMPREEIFDAFACRDAQQERRARAGIEKTGCGLCIAVCPYTREHLRRCGV
ncbi:MAG: 4Fe-4S double cluster binding domain-containing protein [Planctomycetota bacterium]|jgi:epoxyqueuosine reductase QueG